MKSLFISMDCRFVGPQRMSELLLGEGLDAAEIDEGHHAVFLKEKISRMRVRVEQTSHQTASKHKTP